MHLIVDVVVKLMLNIIKVLLLMSILNIAPMVLMHWMFEAHMSSNRVLNACILGEVDVV